MLDILDIGCDIIISLAGFTHVTMKMIPKYTRVMCLFTNSVEVGW